MCIICDNKYTKDTTKINYCCYNVTSIPDILVNLVYLDCSFTLITALPDTLVNLVTLYCYWTCIGSLPDKAINLVTLNCTETLITEIPNTLVNLVYLYCSETLITEIPDTLVNLVTLDCRKTRVSSLPVTLKHIKWLYSDKPFILLYKYGFNNLDVDFRSRYKKLMVLYKALCECRTRGALPLDVYRHYKYYF